MIENIKEKVKQAYQNDKLLYPLVDEMCEEINETETDVENLEVTDLGSGNATAGKVATADGSGNVEWQDVPEELPDYNVSTDEGKVLKVGSEGVEWGSAGGDKLYWHNCSFRIILNSKDYYISTAILSKNDTAYTKATMFAELLRRCKTNSRDQAGFSGWGTGRILLLYVQMKNGTDLEFGWDNGDTYQINASSNALNFISDEVTEVV